MSRVSIIGSGNVGANAAFFIAEKGLADVLLYDVKEGISIGKALDMMEAAPIRNYRTRIQGTDSIEAVKESDVIVVAAGSVRKPKMRREELFDENFGIIKEYAHTISKLCPQAVVIIVTEPIDLLTAVFTKESKFERRRVLGLGGLLDSTRLRYAISRDLGISMENISALVVGRHSEEMIGLENYTSVSGVPILNLMLSEQFEALVNETRRAGDFIVEMAKRSNAYYAPSAAIAELVDALSRDTRRILSVSFLLEGELGIDGAAMSLPAVVGRGGAERVLVPKLSEEQIKKLHESALDMKKKLERRVK